MSAHNVLKAYATIAKSVMCHCLKSVYLFSVANPGNVPVYKTLSECMAVLDQDKDIGLVWILGGCGLYKVCGPTPNHALTRYRDMWG